MEVNNQPSILVRLVHSVPHINVTLNRVNSTFDPKSVIYKEVSQKNLVCIVTIWNNATFIAQSRFHSMWTMSVWKSFHEWTFSNMNEIVVSIGYYPTTRIQKKKRQEFRLKVLMFHLKLRWTLFIQVILHTKICLEKEIYF